ncbi:MAG: EamA family transporter [Chitinophagaceae bacterium]
MKKAFIQLHIAIFLAGYTGVLGRLIALNEGLLVWWRMLLTSISLWILYYFQKKLRKIAFRDVLKIFGVGAIVALHWVTFYGSVKYANVSVSLVCFSAIAFFTAVLEPLLPGRRFQPVDVLLGLLAMAGIYIIFEFDTRYKTGIIIGLISAMLASIFPILNRKLLEKHSVETMTLYEMNGGFLVLTILLPFYLKMFPTDYFFPDLPDFLWLLFLAWACTVLAFNLSMNALKKISAFTVNLSYNLEPVYGILLAFAIYHENKHLGWSFYLGFALILLAVVLQMLRVWRQSRFSLAQPKS